MNRKNQKKLQKSKIGRAIVGPIHRSNILDKVLKDCLCEATIIKKNKKYTLLKDIIVDEEELDHMWVSTIFVRKFQINSRIKFIAEVYSYIKKSGIFSFQLKNLREIKLIEKRVDNQRQERPKLEIYNPFKEQLKRECKKREFVETVMDEFKKFNKNFNLDLVLEFRGNHINIDFKEIRVIINYEEDIGGYWSVKDQKSKKTIKTGSEIQDLFKTILGMK